eukprot:symbB.v1.2.032641.t2/scaffold3945.1/size47733/5
MRQGTGFVAMRDLPESDWEEKDENDETQAQSASSERKVSFSEAAGTGTDSQKAQATRKGTGFVSMFAIARLGSDEDTADEDTATSSDKCDKNKSNRKGTSYVQISELPDDEDEEDEDVQELEPFEPTSASSPQELEREYEFFNGGINPDEAVAYAVRRTALQAGILSGEGGQTIPKSP